MKRFVMSCLTVTFLLVGCAKESASVQPSAVPGPVPVPPRDGAAVAQGLSTDQVLNRASFLGGTLGDRAFHGGQVLLWQPEPNRYRLRASLDLGGGQWRSTNNTNEMVFDQAPFLASLALLNDMAEVERAVPLWAFYGHVETSEITLVEVRIPGVQLQPVDVKQGTWLLVFQGVLTTGPKQAAEVIAYSAASQEIIRRTIQLP